MNNKANKQGFTLIELLVVIAIIGVLASVVLASFNDARAAARDAKRISDLRNMKTALESFYNDFNRYPNETWCDSSIGASSSDCPTMIANGNVQDGWDTSSLFYQQFVGGGYVVDLPVDPINDEGYYYYYEPSNPDGNRGYWFRARLERGGYWAACGGSLEGYASWCN